MEQVPVIDISASIAGDEKGKAKAAAEIRDACEKIGFFTIVGHGVPDSLSKK